MNENENLELIDSENVEPTTEEMGGEEEQIVAPEPKTFTQEEVDAIVGKEKARAQAKVRKEYERKYGQLENVLKAGTGKEDVSEITDSFRSYYKDKGIDIAEPPAYSDNDIKILARAEADDIIKGGFEDAREEADRLAELGAAGMNAREKEVFKHLTEFIGNTEKSRELQKIGVTEDVYNSKEFQDFAAKFSKDTSVTEIYEIFNKMQPKKEYKTMGSMKSTQESKVKDFYSAEEIERLTEDDLDDPQVWDAVRRSMTGKS